MCDLEPAEIFIEDWQKARKVYRCDECAGWFAAGDRYQHIRAMWDHRWGRVRTCTECVQVRDWLVSTQPGWVCGPSYPGLYEYLPREDWPPHMLAAQDALRAERKAA